jgi:hypothetical protein
MTLPPVEIGFADYTVRPLTSDDIEQWQALRDQCADYNWIVEGEPVSPTAHQPLSSFIPDSHHIRCHPVIESMMEDATLA